MLDKLRENLRNKALSEGFSDIGFCAPNGVPQIAERLQHYVDAGHHGQMAWMSERMHWRGNPAALWPEARSVVMLAETYTPEHDPLDVLQQPDNGAISVYAQNRDYHDILKKRLKRVGRWLIEQQPDSQIKVFVDTAPVMEKPLAAAAGLGWQGKHTNLVSRKLGNWFFLGAIFTSLDFAKDQPEDDHCGNCTNCLDICPTNAFTAPYQLDARRCISYLTIEFDGPVDPELRSMLGNHIYGCDECLAVCPWNKFAQQATEIGYAARAEMISPDLGYLAGLNDAEFRTLFTKSPVKRIKRDRFVRNVLYAIGNSGQQDLLPTVLTLQNDENAVVRDAADWARNRLENR